MDHVRWTDRPRLRTPVLIAAFEGWNDAGDAATVAARYLRDRWSGRPFAQIDAEDFYDFSTTRPQVRLTDGVTREIVWPVNEFSAASVPGAARDVVVLVGHEPQLRWRTFCEQVVAMANELDVAMVLTLGALLADVAHSRPVSVMGTAADSELIERLGLQRSRYEGPTGIVGVLHDACGRAGLPSASLWAAVPAYVPGAPSPKAALALVERASELLDVPLAATDLQIASAAYERQVSELVASDDDMSLYVQKLEQRDEHEDDDDEEDDGDPIVVSDPQGSAEELVEEVERFLRDHKND